MSLSALLGALAREANTTAIMIEEAGVSRAGYCFRKSEMFRLASDGFAQAAALETESDDMIQVWRSRATKAAASADFWERHARLHEDIDALTFEPA